MKLLSSEGTERQVKAQAVSPSAPSGTAQPAWIRRISVSGISKQGLALPCLVSSSITAVALFFLLHLRRLDLHVPFVYWGDALFFDSWVKNLLDGNWQWNNPHLGMPLGADWHDFPDNQTTEAIVAKIFSIFTSSPGLVLNLIWLLAVIVCAGLATYGLQRVGVHKWIGTCLGAIYALQPFAFYRGVSHFSLLFYLVPLLAAGAVEIAAGKFFADHDQTPKTSILGTKHTLRAIPAYIYWGCIAQGFTYIYDSFFGVVLFAVAGLLAWTTNRRKHVIAALVAVCIICAATLINLSPNIVYWVKHGRNPAMAYKQPIEADTYGLKLRTLLTPTPQDPIPPLRHIEKKIDIAFNDAKNEAGWSRLGVIGSVGLLFLLGWALISCIRKPSTEPTSGVLGACSALTLAALLVATVGGFGSLFNIFVAPDIRAYNRIVVFIDFFALAAVGILLTRSLPWFRRRFPRAVLLSALGLLLVFGICDEAVGTVAAVGYQDYPARQRQFRLDDSFVKEVQAILPRNAMVFQLPFTAFPLAAPHYRLLPYDQSRPYLHSRTLRWSWGAMMGRKGGDWVQATSSLPVPQMLSRLAAAGFSGLWIDRFGYAPGTSPEQKIAEALNSVPLVRSDGRIAFYDLRSYAKRLKSSGQLRKSALYPVELTFPVGFYAKESNDKQSWRWCLRHGVMQIYNTASRPRTVRIEGILQTGSARPKTIRISGAGKAEDIGVSSSAKRFSRTVHLSAGQILDLTFDCDCKPVAKSSAGKRILYFALIDPRVIWNPRD